MVALIRTQRKSRGDLLKEGSRPQPGLMVVLAFVTGIVAYPIMYDVFFFGFPTKEQLHVCMVGYEFVICRNCAMLKWLV